MRTRVCIFFSLVVAVTSMEGGPSSKKSLYDCYDQFDSIPSHPKIGDEMKNTGEIYYSDYSGNSGPFDEGHSFMQSILNRNRQLHFLMNKHEDVFGGVLDALEKTEEDPRWKSIRDAFSYHERASLYWKYRKELRDYLILYLTSWDHDDKNEANLNLILAISLAVNWGLQIPTIRLILSLVKGARVDYWNIVQEHLTKYLGDNPIQGTLAMIDSHKSAMSDARRHSRKRFETAIKALERYCTEGKKTEFVMAVGSSNAKFMKGTLDYDEVECQHWGFQNPLYNLAYFPVEFANIDRIEQIVYDFRRNHDEVFQVLVKHDEKDLNVLFKCDARSVRDLLAKYVS